MSLRQKIDDTVFSSRYLAKVSETLLETVGLLNPAAHVIIREAKRVMKRGSKCKERIERFTLAPEKTVSARSSLSTEFPPTNISDDRANERVYSVTDSCKEGREGGKMKD